MKSNETRGAGKWPEVRDWCNSQSEPFTYEDAVKGTSAAYSTCRRLVFRWAVANCTYCAWGVWGNKNFYRIFAPHWWTFGKFKCWLDDRCDSGKSRAKIYTLAPF